MYNEYKGKVGGMSEANNLVSDVVFARMTELVKRSGLSRSKLYALIKEGKLPKPQTLPGSSAALFEVAAFDAALRRLLQEGSNPPATTA